MHATRAWTMMFLSGLVFLAAVVLGAAPVSAYEECHEAGPATSCTSVSTNSPPEPDFSWAHTGNGTVAFTDESRDDGSIVRWLWTFGDGNSSNATHPEHVYAPGSYGVRLQVEDDQGAVANTTRIIEVPEDTGTDDGSGDGTDGGSDDGTDGGSDDGTDDGTDAGNGTDDGSGAGNGTDDEGGAGNGTDSGSDGDVGNGTDDGQTGNGTDNGQTGNGTEDGQTTGNSTGGNSTEDAGSGENGNSTTGDGGDDNATGDAGDDRPDDQEQGARAGGRARGDADGDGVADGHDVCPAVVDPDQADHDGDGVGDACGDAPAGCTDCAGNATAEVHGDVGPGATNIGSGDGAAPAGRGLEPAPVHDHYETSYPAWEGPRSEAPALWAIVLVCTGMLAPGLLANTWRATQHVRARRRAADPFRA